MRQFVLLAGMLVVFGGCFDYQAAPRYADQVPGSLAEAEPAVVALEDATGKGLSDSTVSKGISITEKVERFAKVGAKAAAMASAVPGPWTPFTGAAAGILGALGTAAGGLATFFQRRKRRNAERGLSSVVKAVDNVQGIGKQITRHAREDGTVDVIEAAYNGKLTT